jgi:hypothetical protein
VTGKLDNIVDFEQQAIVPVFDQFRLSAACAARRMRRCPRLITAFASRLLFYMARMTLYYAGVDRAERVLVHLAIIDAASPPRERREYETSIRTA